MLWAVVVGLWLVALMRIFAWDDLEFFAVLNAVTAFVYLPSWVIAPLAVLGRRPYLAVAALSVIVAQVVFMFPELTAAGPLPAWVRSAPTFRILDANVYQGNPSMVGYADEITSVRPQVVTLEESGPVDVRRLERSGALDGLPYRLDVPRHDPFAFFVASAYPLTATHVLSLFSRPLIVQTTVRLLSGTVTLWVVHAVAPLPVSFAQWQGQMATIARQVRARGTAGLLLVGDFNATWGSRGFHAILDTGLVDGAAARGEPFAMTWSQIEPVVPPLVRIDHLLTGPGVAVRAIRTGTGPGSDHRELVATVAVEPRPNVGAHAG